jgi:two-component system, NtrC family, sensor histidine kinase GlrK
MVFPQTLLRLVVGCFLLTAIPLSIAIGRLALNLNDLAQRSQVAVKRAEAVGAISRDLRNAGVAVERTVRQALVLDDASMVDDAVKSNRAFITVLTRAEVLPIDVAQKQSIDRLRGQTAQISTMLGSGLPAESARPEVVDAAMKLSELADTVGYEFDSMVSREIAEIEVQASKGSSTWPWMVGTSALLAGVLGLGFSIFLSRPLRSLDRSIRRMGEARFDTPVTIKGPPDLRSLGERLEWLRTRLAELESHQANFLRQVSHELKTPLTAIREGTELLNDRVTGELSEGQEELVRIIRENSLQLQKLISDLLTYQQHRTASPLKREPVHLPDLVQAVVDSHRIPVLAKAISTRVHVVPVKISVEREKMRVILDNLMSNAIKYSPKSGQIFVAARIAGDFLQIDVSDQGPGVSLVDKVKIFESFYQGQNVPNASVKGTGLGLAITRDFVIAHGGDIDVIEAGKPGGRFRVRLPIDQNTIVEIGEFHESAVAP